MPNQCSLPDLGKLSPFLALRSKKAASLPKPQLQELGIYES